MKLSELINEYIEIKIDQAMEDHAYRDHDCGGHRIGDSRPDRLAQLAEEINRCCADKFHIH